MLAGMRKPTDPKVKELMQGGTVRRITRWDEAVMRQPTSPITDFDDALQDLARDMFATMAKADGVGLAATQVGVSRSIFVFSCPDADGHIVSGIVCNPEVELPTGKDRNLDGAEEGCLSWPGAYQHLARPDKAICRGQDVEGNDIEIVGTGLLARCLQHETDHLQGTVFGDRLSKRARRQLDEQKEAVAELYPDDWPVSPKRPRSAE